MLWTQGYKKPFEGHYNPETYIGQSVCCKLHEVLCIR